MPELFTVLKTRRDLNFEEHKFLAALQGADLGGEKKTENWRDRMEERVRERHGKKEEGTPKNDITRLRGHRAKELGFGIGMGLDYSQNSSGNPLLG